MFPFIQSFNNLHLFLPYDSRVGVKNVVDLCAAPGSWSQVLSRRLYLPAVEAGVPEAERPKIVAIDLQPMAPIDGIVLLQGDITSKKTAEEVISHFDGNEADLVISDGAPDGEVFYCQVIIIVLQYGFDIVIANDFLLLMAIYAVTGLHDLDEYVQAQLILAALAIVSATLRRGGTFVAKIFRGRDISILYSQLKILFRDVTIAKPKSSRNSSIESFVVCQDYSPPEGLNPSTIQQLLEVGDYDSIVTGNVSQEIKQSVPFLACGDLRGWDYDASYALPCPDYKTLDAVQPPIAPPYKEVLERMKHTSMK